jgi:hypothetical protein
MKVLGFPSSCYIIQRFSGPHYPLPGTAHQMIFLMSRILGAVRGRLCPNRLQENL